MIEHKTSRVCIKTRILIQTLLAFEPSADAVRTDEFYKTNSPIPWRTITGSSPVRSTTVVGSLWP